MSRRRLLLAGGSGDVAPPPDPIDPDPPTPSGPVSLTFDGNSITAGAGSPDPLINYVVEYLTSTGELNGARYLKGGMYQTGGISGQQWTDMAANHGDVDTFWDPARTNVLIVSEDSNAVFQSPGRSVEQAIQDARDYFTAMRAVHPGWLILMWGNLPRSGDPDQNADLIAINDYWRNNWEDEGLVGWIDMRDGIPQYDHDGSGDALFAAYADGWAETFAPFVHPTAGSYEDNTGMRALAQRIGDTLVAMEWWPA